MKKNCENEKEVLISLFHEVNMRTASLEHSPTLTAVYDLLENRLTRMYGDYFYENWLGV